MGSLPRPKPKRLANKLRQIRLVLDVSQAGMVEQLGFSQLVRSNISAYERGIREPPLPILLAYARNVGVCVEVLIDDNLELPTTLPAQHRHFGGSVPRVKHIQKNIKRRQ